MKTRIPIKKYVLPEATKKIIDFAADKGIDGTVARDIALEYRMLETHHKEETEFLIKRIEELEKECEGHEKYLRETSELRGR